MSSLKTPSTVHSVRLKDAQEEFLHQLQASLLGAADTAEVDWSLRDLLSLMEENREPLEIVALMIAENKRLKKAQAILEELAGNSYFQAEPAFKEQIKNMRAEFNKKLKEYDLFKRQSFLELTKSLDF